jgi:ADP-ribose pyrophosphatase
MPEADDAHLREHGLASSTLLDSGYLDLRRDTVRLPDGGTATRDYIRHVGAVAVIPLLDDGPAPRVVLVRQHRYPVDCVLLEWPAGRREPGEDSLVTAKRELLEETGYTAREWAHAGDIHNAAAYSSERIELWFARGLEPGPARPDAGEFVETVVMPLAELLALDRAGGLSDVKTIIGLHWLREALTGHRPHGGPGTAAAHGVPWADDEGA